MSWTDEYKEGYVVEVRSWDNEPWIEGRVLDVVDAKGVEVRIDEDQDLRKYITDRDNIRVPPKNRYPIKSPERAIMRALLNIQSVLMCEYLLPDRKDLQESIQELKDLLQETTED